MYPSLALGNAEVHATANPATNGVNSVPRKVMISGGHEPIREYADLPSEQVIDRQVNPLLLRQGHSHANIGSTWVLPNKLYRKPQCADPLVFPCGCRYEARVLQIMIGVVVIGDVRAVEAVQSKGRVFSYPAFFINYLKVPAGGIIVGIAQIQLLNLVVISPESYLIT